MQQSSPGDEHSRSSKKGRISGKRKKKDNGEKRRRKKKKDPNAVKISTPRTCFLFTRHSGRRERLSVFHQSSRFLDYRWRRRKTKRRARPLSPRPRWLRSRGETGRRGEWSRSGASLVTLHGELLLLSGWGAPLSALIYSAPTEDSALDSRYNSVANASTDG